jgi:LCP family protein required for cell wall assembly
MVVDPASGGGSAATHVAKDVGSPGLPALAGKSARRKWPRRLLIAVNVVVLALLLVGITGYGYVKWRFGQVKHTDVVGLSPAGPGSAPLTILMVGSDTRDLGKGGSAAFGNPQDVSGQRSDTIMLVRIVPATASIALLSVPRDLLVPVPGLGTTRINAAFGGGPDLLVQTVRQGLGIAINHFAVVNFDTFTQIADAIGGVYQYFPTPARDLFSGLTVTHAGCVLLKGPQALAFVRSREYQYFLDGSWQYQLVPESDLARIQRQQDFIKLALKKAADVAPYNPLTLNRVLSGVASSLTVDTSFSSSLMLNLALDLRHSNVSGVPTWTYPTVNSTEVPGALDPVPSEDEQVLHAFLTYGAPKASTTTTTGPALARSAISISVLNGSGTADQATQAANALRAAGFEVRSTGDASAFNYTQSVIEYGPDGSAAARIVQKTVPGGATLQEVTSLTGNDLVLVTGRSYGGTTTMQAAAPVPATGLVLAVATRLTGTVAPAPVSTDSSSYYDGRYIPPGLEPGQVPETCPS